MKAYLCMAKLTRDHSIYASVPISLRTVAQVDIKACHNLEENPAFMDQVAYTRLLVDAVCLLT